MSLLSALVYGRGWRTHDARGREVPLYNHLGSNNHGTVPAEVFDRIRTTANARASSGWETGGRVLGWLFVSAILYGTVAEFVKTPGGITAGRVVGLLFCPAVVACVLIFGRKFVRGSPENFARAMREHGHCPSCGYPLAPSADAATTCSECGAVWRTSGCAPVAKTAPPAPTE